MICWFGGLVGERSRIVSIYLYDSKVFILAEKSKISKLIAFLKTIP